MRHTPGHRAQAQPGDGARLGRIGQVHDGLGHRARVHHGQRRADAPARVVGAMRQARRIDERGRHIAHMHLGQVDHLGAQAFGQAAQAELAGRVGGRVGRGHPAAQRDQVHQQAVALRAKARERRVRAVHVAQQVGLDHAAVRGQRHIVKAPHGSHAHAVDPHIDAPEVAHRLVGQGLHRVGVGHVGGNAQRLPALGAAGQRHRGERVRVARGQHQARAAARKRQRRGVADTAGGAGDHHHRIGRGRKDAGRAGGQSCGHGAAGRADAARRNEGQNPICNRAGGATA